MGEGDKDKKKRVERNSKVMEKNKKIAEKYQKAKIQNIPPGKVEEKGGMRKQVVSGSVGMQKERDPGVAVVPKRPVSASYFFCEARRPRVRADNPRLKMGEVSRELTRLWTSSDQSVRNEFEEEAEQDRQRYDREMLGYNQARRKTGYMRKPLKVEN